MSSLTVFITLIPAWWRTQQRASNGVRKACQDQVHRTTLKRAAVFNKTLWQLPESILSTKWT